MAKFAFLTLALALAPISSAFQIPKVAPSGEFKLPSHGHSKGSGFLKISVSKKVNNPVTSKVNKNSTSSRRQVSTYVDNARPVPGTVYLIDIKIGSPAQTVSIQIDTGSSDTWVNPNCTNSAWPGFCEQYPVYDTVKSTTDVNTKTSYSFGYGSGTANGVFYTDDISIGAATIKQQQFGVSTTSSYIYTGIMGLSFGKGLCTNYYNIIDQLALQQVINSRAFSLDLGSVTSAQGSIIFGGIDTMKFSGTLSKVPIIPARQAPEATPRYWVSLTGVGMTTAGSGSTSLTGSGYSLGVILDSGSTLSALPTAIVTSMLARVSGAASMGGGMYTVPCSHLNDATTIDFTFGTTTIRVPIYQMIWQNGGLCIWGVTATSSVDAILGDSFLRAAYAVFDQDNMNVWLAQAANCGSKLVAIGSGANAVTSMTGGCAASGTAAATSTKTSTSNTATISSAKSVKNLSTVAPALVASTTTSATSRSSSSTSSSRAAAISTTASSTRSSTSSRASSPSMPTSTSSSRLSTWATTTTAPTCKTSTVTATVTTTKTLYKGWFW